MRKNTNTLMIYLDDALKDRLSKYKEMSGRALAWTTREALKEFLDREEKVIKERLDKINNPEKFAEAVV